MVNMSAEFDEDTHNGLVSYGVHKVISVYVHFDLDLWPPKSTGFILSPQGQSMKHTRMDGQNHGSVTISLLQRVALG